MMEDLIHIVFSYLLKVIETTASQIFILLGPGLILAFIMYYISTILRNESSAIFGYRIWIYSTAIGTVIHELGHALFAILFGHKIIDMKLFIPDPDSDVLGYVQTSYKKDNLYQSIGKFFFGIGPIILGSIVIYFSSKYLMGSQLFNPFKQLSIDNSTFSSITNFWEFIQEVFRNSRQLLLILFQLDNLKRWEFYLFLYLVSCYWVSCKVKPS
jgi:hypothetical protein